MVSALATIAANGGGGGCNVTDSNCTDGIDGLLSVAPAPGEGVTKQGSAGEAVPSIHAVADEVVVLASSLSLVKTQQL